MLIIAQQKNVRQSPRKVRLVANAVKKLPLDQAIAQLAVIERKATITLLKVVKQAISNATNNLGIAYEDLTLNNIIVGEGSTYRRMRAVSRGRGHSIDKKTCHIKVILEQKEKVQ